MAVRTRQKFADTWPIDEIAGRPPRDWPGWPDGKRFAVVLTHDVEGLRGLEMCPTLQRIEIAEGFHSSYNFVPEGEYNVSPGLRQQITDAGFEVGVHDLRHDGKLFRGSEVFERNAKSINRFAREWNAVGFRAGFMLRNLDWYHSLNILYDASTFDTDPFEPQPQGARTIFPFWLSRKSHHNGINRSTSQGYVELPYTLPQDSTLFLILGETSPKVWIEKLHWVAKHGGMVLLNVHPDYIRFSPEDEGKLLYPIEHYTDLLRMIRTEYAGQYWNPLPKELALWYKQHHTRSSLTVTRENTDCHSSGALRGKRVAVILYSEFPGDPRPRRAAEAMVQEGMEVDLFCLDDDAPDTRGKMMLGVRVFGFRMRKRRDSRIMYFLKYGSFLFAAFWFLTKRTFRRRYDVVHVHNMPDILVFSALVPKLLGAKVILDLHDPMPELLRTIFGGEEKSLSVRVLRWLEKISIGFAHRVITVNVACKRLFSHRSCAEEKIDVIMNSPDERIFSYRDVHSVKNEDPSTKSSFVLMYHGSLVDRHGLDLAVNALGSVLKEIPHAKLRVFGMPTAYLKNVLDSIQDPVLKESVQYCGSKPLEEIVEEIQQCDVGLIPNRRSIFTEINTPTRIFEYLSQGKPVIAPSSAGILDYFGAADLIYFKLGDQVDLAEKIRYVYNNPAEVREIVGRGQKVFRGHSWSRERNHFLRTVEDLLYGSKKSTAPINKSEVVLEGQE